MSLSTECQAKLNPYFTGSERAIDKRRLKEDSLAFECCVINYHKLRDLKQQKSLIS